MKIASVIAEYNPFHNGHLYQIGKIKKDIASHLVVIMSGNFVQRGDFSVLNKYDRARAAVFSGADLVLELPIASSLSSAEGFSDGAIEIIKALGCVDYLSFGGETESLSTLKNGSKLLNHKNLEIKKYLDQGFSYPKSRQSAAEELNRSLKLLSESEILELSSPNNILGMEYLRSLEKKQAKIIPHIIRRHKVGHHSKIIHEDFASATKIRSLIYEQKKWQAYVPKTTGHFYEKLLEKGEYIDENKKDFMVLSYLKRLKKEDFLKTEDVSEGLENRIYNMIKISMSLFELYNNIKTKRYTEARIRRIILNTFLGINKSEDFSPKYLKVLGFNDKGREVLRKAKKSGTLPIVTNLSQVKNISKNHYNLEKRSSALYGYCMKTPYKSQWEFKRQVKMINDLTL